jgi:ABC-type transporter MlaC component
MAGSVPPFMAAVRFPKGPPLDRTSHPMIGRHDFARAVTLSLCALAALFWLGCGATARGETFARAAASAIGAMGDEMQRTVLVPGFSEAERGRGFALILSRHFDMAAIARQSLGYHWSAATPEQRREFTELFTTMWVKDYGGMMRADLALPFSVTGQRDEGPRAALVLSQLGQRTDPDFLRIDWRMQLAEDGQPRIIDVIVSGVSLVRSGQEDFDASIRQSGRGMEGLLQLLRTKYATPTAMPK